MCDGGDNSVDSNVHTFVHMGRILIRTIAFADSDDIIDYDGEIRPMKSYLRASAYTTRVDKTRGSR